MSFQLEVRDRASNELIEGYLWYESQRDGLGEEFHDEVEAHFAFLRSRPKGFAKWRGPFQKLNLKRFPYVIVFRVIRNTIIIFSVFHNKRDPKSWGHVQ